MTAPVEIRKFAPVDLPDGIDLDRLSQTFLRSYNSCPRAGYLYLTVRGARSHEMERGSALHHALEVMVKTMIAEGEPTIPPELAKDIVNEAIAEYAVPIEEHDYLRESVYRWASQAAIEPTEVVACETLYVWEIAGFQVRAKIDLALMKAGGLVFEIEDYKSSRHAPALEEISRKRSDGTYHAKNFQLILYALMLVFGVPVRRERQGDEYVEIPEPMPVAGRAEEIRLRFVYPGIEKRDGSMLTQEMTLERHELFEYRDSLVAILQRVAESQTTGDWPAIPGDHCVECPAKMLCPIPAELRDFAGAINTPEEAAEAAAQLDREKAVHAARTKELKGFVKTLPGQSLRWGGNQVWEIVTGNEVVEIKDKDGMFEAIERAVTYGEPFNENDWVKRRTPTNFKARTLTAEELDGETAEETGDIEADRDARFGEEAPF